MTVRPSPYVVFAQKRALRELSLPQILHLQTTSRELFSRTSMLGALSQSCEESRPTAPTSKETARTRKSGDQEQNHFRKLQIYVLLVLIEYLFMLTGKTVTGVEEFWGALSQSFEEYKPTVSTLKETERTNGVGMQEILENLGSEAKWFPDQLLILYLSSKNKTEKPFNIQSCNFFYLMMV